MRKVLSILLAGIMIFSASMTSAYALGSNAMNVEETINEKIIAFGECGENLTWVLDCDGLLSISGTGEMYDYWWEVEENQTPPWYEYSDKIKSLNIEEGITRIGMFAFMECKELTGNLNLPESLLSIGNGAFSWCCKLSGDLIIPENTVSIGQDAFFNARRIGANVFIPETVEEIGNTAFSECYEVKNVIFKGTAPRLGEKLFEQVTEKISCYYPLGVEGWDQVITEDYNGQVEWIGYADGAAPWEKGVSRIYGNNRNATSREIADELKVVLNKDKFDSVIIATSSDYADALAGSYLAIKKEAPILLTNGKTDTNNDLLAYVRKNAENNAQIYILGKENAVSAEVETLLKKYYTKVDRLGGKSRLETNKEILDAAGIEGESELIVSTSKNFADSLSASATGKPILLVNPEKSLNADQKEILNHFRNGKVYIVGGKNAVNEKCEEEIKKCVGADNVERIQGSGRYATSVEIAKKFFENSQKAVVATGENFPDGLCGGPLAAASNAPLLLTKEGNTKASQYAVEQKISAGYVLGGANAVKNDVVNELFDLSTIRVILDISDEQSEMWKKVCDAFTTKTGIKVEFDTTADLESELSAAEENGELPDITNLSATNELTIKYLEEEKIENITDVLSMTVSGERTTVSEKIINGIDETSSTNPYLDGNLYLAPTFYSPCGLFYNAGLFEEKGWDVPSTWSEMWTLGDKAKEEGMYLFTYPTTAYMDSLFYALLYSVGDVELFEKMAENEEGIWETEETQRCLEIIAKLSEYTHPLTPEYANDEDFMENQQQILNNETLFIVNGPWYIDEMEGCSREEGFQWGFTAVPAVDKDGDRYSYIWHENVWIPSEAKHKESAKQFIGFLYSDIAVEIFADGGANMSVKGIDKFLDGDYKTLYSAFNDGAKASTGVFYGYYMTEETGSVRELIYDPINKLVSGELTKEEWISSIISGVNQMREKMLF